MINAGIHSLGLFWIAFFNIHIHFLIYPGYWELGYRKYNYPENFPVYQIKSFGLGPLLTVVWGDD